MKKIVITNKENVVVLVLPLNEEDLLDMAAYAGLISNPNIVEVGSGSQAVIGWKYIDGLEVEPVV